MSTTISLCLVLAVLIRLFDLIMQVTSLVASASPAHESAVAASSATATSNIFFVFVSILSSSMQHFFSNPPATFSCEFSKMHSVVFRSGAVVMVLDCRFDGHKYDPDHSSCISLEAKWLRPV